MPRDAKVRSTALNLNSGQLEFTFSTSKGTFRLSTDSAASRPAPDSDCLFNNATKRLSLYANGGYYNRELERPVSRKEISGGNNYNTVCEGYNWGSGAKYKLSRRNVLQFDYSGNNYASRYKCLVENMVTSRSTKFSNLTEAEQARLCQEFPEMEGVAESRINIKNYFNFEKATVKGVEVNLNSTPFPGFTLAGNYTHSWGDYTLSLNLNGRLQSKVYYPGDADGTPPGYGIWNLHMRHTLSGFRNFTIEPGIGIDNLFDKRDNRPQNKNFALYSPGRSVVISLALKLK